MYRCLLGPESSRLLVARRGICSNTARCVRPSVSTPMSSTLNSKSHQLLLDLAAPSRLQEINTSIIRCMSHGPPAHWKTDKQIDEQQLTTMNHLPVPEGSWQGNYQANQKKYNLLLGVSTSVLALTVFSMYKTNCFDFNTAPAYKDVVIDNIANMSAGEPEVVVEINSDVVPEVAVPVVAEEIAVETASETTAPAEESAETAVTTEEAPAETPAEEPVAPATPTEEIAALAEETVAPVAPAEETAAVPVEEPAVAPVEEPAAAPVEEPAAAPVEEPAAAPVEEPTVVPVEEPVAAAPAEESVAAPAEEPVAVPTEEPAAPADESGAAAPPPSGDEPPPPPPPTEDTPPPPPPAAEELSPVAPEEPAATVAPAGAQTVAMDWSKVPDIPTHVPYLLIGAGTASFAAFRHLCHLAFPNIATAHMH